MFGGIHITNSPNATDTVQFTTIVNNHAETNVVGGVLCDGETQSLTFSSNIISGNDLANNAETSGGGCAYTFSDFFPTSAFELGTGNGSGDPMLDSEYKLQAGSYAIDRADGSATITIDYFGDKRPDGSGFDMGADEY